MAVQRDTVMEDKPDVGSKIAATGGALGALAMTSCCILPLVLFSLGVTSAWIGRLGAMSQYKWVFFAFAGLSLAYGFRKVYQPAREPCENGADCSRPVNQRITKIVLWVSAGLVLAALLFPYVSPVLIGY